MRTLLTMLIVLPCVLFAGLPNAAAQQHGTITGDRLSGFVLPVEPVFGEIRLSALRGWAWEVDDTQRLHLEGDVRITIAGQHFSSPAAAVWINRIPSQDGVINQIAVYFSEVRNPAQVAGSGVAGRDLLVTGSTRGEVELNAAVVTRHRPSTNDLLQRGERRLARHLADTVREPPPPLHRRTFVDQLRVTEERFHPVPGEVFTPEPRVDDERVAPGVGVPAEPRPWLASPAGVVRFAAEQIEIITATPDDADGEHTITLLGPITIEYLPAGITGDLRRLTLTAERAVIFADPVPLEQALHGQVGAEHIRGIYLEGNVMARAAAEDGGAGGTDAYVVRSPLVYYDFRADRAVMLDAVLRTHSRSSGRLVYARAREIRQEAEHQWTADRVRVSTSEFHTPHIAIGSRRMTITRVEPEGGVAGDADLHLDARDVTLRAVDVPFFYWPFYRGTLTQTPLRRISVGSRNNDGLRVQTTWNLFTLAGVEPPAGVESDLRLDGFSKRGIGIGTEVRYRGSQDGLWGLGMGDFGLLDLYGLYDTGIDRTDAGLNVDPMRNWRGVALWEHHSQFLPDWLFQAQASYISDETFISAWRPDDFLHRREYETSAYLKHQRNNAAVTLLAQHELNDFVSNNWILASRGYQVDRMPEFSYRRYADSFLDGRLTWSSETRLTRARLVMHDRTAIQTGVPPTFGGAFGPGLVYGAGAGGGTVEAALRAMGMHTRHVMRGDTRHDLAVPLQYENILITPFFTGRATLYDDDFAMHVGGPPAGAEKFRYFGSAGVSVATEFHHIDNAVESRLFDLHRLRHIIQPSVTIWWAHSNAGRGDYPIYDEDVEGIAHGGGAVRLALRNIWQTQRGGPGRWRSVDVLTVDVAGVLRTSDADRRYPTPQFFDFRPEYSQFGDHIDGSFIWQVSDALALTGRGVWDLEAHHFARSSLGAELRHSPVLVTFVEYRRVAYPAMWPIAGGGAGVPVGAFGPGGAGPAAGLLPGAGLEVLDVGWSYQLTPKYRVLISPQIDLRGFPGAPGVAASRSGDLRAINVRVTRSFPDFELIVLFRHDRITDETTVGASLGAVRF